MRLTAAVLSLTNCYPKINVNCALNRPFEKHGKPSIISTIFEVLDKNLAISNVKMFTLTNANLGIRKGKILPKGKFFGKMSGEKRERLT